MPRLARVKEKYAFYHIYNRGNNKDIIFKDDRDKEVFLSRIRRYIDKYKFILLGICIMDNHFHLLINSNGSDISEVMKGISSSYAAYYREKYDHCGHIFQGRFKSKLLKDEISVITEANYIHCNPLKAQIVESPEDYKFSSLIYYLTGVDIYNIFDNSLIMAMLGNKRQTSADNYVNLLNEYMKVNGYKAQVRANLRSNYNCYLKDFEKNNKIKRDYDPNQIIQAFMQISSQDTTYEYSRSNKPSPNPILIHVLSLHCGLNYVKIGKLLKHSDYDIGRWLISFLDKLSINRDLQEKLYFYEKSLG